MAVAIGEGSMTEMDVACTAGETVATEICMVDWIERGCI